MSFSKNDLEIIKSKISIVSEIEKKSRLVQKGKDYWCCCPFHEEKTPSCKINEDQGSFYCFGCGSKGDIFTIYTDLYNYNFVDAVKELSNQAGIQINFQKKIHVRFFTIFRTGFIYVRFYNRILVVNLLINICSTLLDRWNYLGKFKIKKRSKKSF